MQGAYQVVMHLAGLVVPRGLFLVCFSNGLVIVNANPYVYPLVTAGIIFLAVLVDSQRARILANINRRTIRVEEA